MEKLLVHLALQTDRVKQVDDEYYYYYYYYYIRLMAFFPGQPG